MKKKVFKKLKRERQNIFNAKLIYIEDTQTWEVVENYHSHLCTLKRFLKTFERTMPLTNTGYNDHYGLMIGDGGRVIDILDYFKDVNNQMRFFIVNVWADANTYKNTAYFATPNTMEEFMNEPL